MIRANRKTLRASALLAAVLTLGACSPQASDAGASPEVALTDSEVTTMADDMGVPEARRAEFQELLMIVAKLNDEGFPSGVSYDREREAFVINTDAPADLTADVVSEHPGVILVPGGLVGQ